MVNYLKDTKTSMAKFKTELMKAIESHQNKLKFFIEKNKKEIQKTKGLLKKNTKTLKLTKTPTASKKISTTIKTLEREHKELLVCGSLLKVKETHLKDVTKVAKETIKFKKLTKGKSMPHQMIKKKPINKQKQISGSKIIEKQK